MQCYTGSIKIPAEREFYDTTAHPPVRPAPGRYEERRRPHAYGNLASLVGMACNLLLCLGKLAAGTLFGSIAIMADA